MKSKLELTIAQHAIIMALVALRRAELDSSSKEYEILTALLMQMSAAKFE